MCRHRTQKTSVSSKGVKERVHVKMHDPERGIRYQCE
jgi:hypothetical protein